MAAGLVWSAHGMTISLLCPIAVVTAGLAVASVLCEAPRGVWSCAGMYLLVYAVFHFGAVALYAVGIDAEDAMAGALRMDWFFGPYTCQGLAIAVLGCCACASGAMVALGRRESPPDRRLRDDADRTLRGLFGLAGTLALGTTIAVWLGAVMAKGGLQVLFGSYQAFLACATLEKSVFIQSGILVGVTLVAAASPSLWRTAGMLLFVFWTLLTLPLGLRTGILFPLAGALVVHARRRRPVSTLTFVAAVVALLVVVSAVKQVRQTGLGEARFRDIASSPLGGLAELGYSLRPVVEVVRWADQGEPYLLGATYANPFRRALARLAPWLGRTDAQNDDLLMNVLVVRLVGAIGFSVVAEAHRNFGVPGVVLILFGIGYLMGRMDRWRVSGWHDAAAGMIFIPLLIEVRNAFVPVPVQIALGLISLGAVRWALSGVVRGTRGRQTRPSLLPAGPVPVANSNGHSAPWN
ncbi:MAG: O-antigen polysaccharide polymerase Wzy family protein [Thermoguttaceae bacterium]|nr:O-antigen polysaccharide polymerase Wzy family protein [Thermoguttaceae bacterium]